MNCMATRESDSSRQTCSWALKLASGYLSKISSINLTWDLPRQSSHSLIKEAGCINPSSPPEAVLLRKLSIGDAKEQ